jgi:hypothetical protein
MVDLATGKQIDEGSRQIFVSLPLPNGKYSLSFTPKTASCGTWNITINVEQAQVYQGQAGTRQKITANQIVSVKDLPAKMHFSSSTAGKWTVGGLNETVYEAKTFDFTVPTYFAGMSIPVAFVPNGGDESSATHFFIQAGAQAAALSAVTSSDLGMDIVEQVNAMSTPTEEKYGLAQNSSVTIYQNSLYKLWITPNAEAVIKDWIEYKESDSGYWTVNNVLATNDYLNWNDTALNLAGYGKGTYKIQYLSKTDARRQWSGTVQVIQDFKPAGTKGSCGRLGVWCHPDYPVSFCNRWKW